MIVNMYWLLCLLACHLVSASFPSIYLESPTNGRTYVAKEDNKVSIALQFSLFGAAHNSEETDEKYSFCLDVFSIDRGASVIDLTCMRVLEAQNNVALTFPTGQYRITAVLREKATDVLLEQSRLVNNFAVVSLAQTLPKIFVNVPAGDIEVVANAANNLATIQIPVAIIPSDSFRDTSSREVYTICVKVEDQVTKVALIGWTCLAPTDTSLSLSQLRQGHSYEVTLRLRNIHNTDTSSASLIESSQVVKTIVIHSLLDKLPDLIPSSDLLQYGVDTTLQIPQNTAAVDLEYALSSSVLPNAINQLFVCLTWVRLGTYKTAAEYSAFDEEQVIAEYSCSSAQHTRLTISRQEVGRYRATLSLSVDQRTPIVLPTIQGKQRQSHHIIDVDIRPMTEFVPSYDWQHLAPWHTIPSGIETRLPLSDLHPGTNIKEARIPNPWRLQLPLPAKLCSKVYFLRMNVQRNMAIKDILQEVVRVCGPVPTHLLHRAHHDRHNHHRQQQLRHADDAHKSSSDAISGSVDSHEPSGDNLEINSTKSSEESAVESTSLPPTSDILYPVACFGLWVESNTSTGDESASQGDGDIAHLYTAADTGSDDVTVESSNLFNAARKEIRWLGGDHPELCFHIELL